MRRITSLAICVCLFVSLFVSLQQPGRAQTPKMTAKLLHTITESFVYWWSPDNKTLAVMFRNISLYDVATGKVRAEFKSDGLLSVKLIRFTPDSSALLVHTDRVRLYSAADGKLLREFAEDTAPINYYEKIYTTQYTSTYNAETGQNESGYEGPTYDEELRELPTRYISDRVISPDSKLLLVRAKESGKALVYDLTTGELKFTLDRYVEAGKKKDRVGKTLGEFSPDGRFIVTAPRDRTPRLWNAANGALIANLGPQTSSVLGVRFSPDSRFVATSTFDDGIVKIWEADTGKLLHTVGSKKESVYFAEWNPTSKSFVTKSSKAEIGLWSAETGTLIAKLDQKAVNEKFDWNLTFVYSPDGRILVTQAKNKPSVWSLLGGVVKDKRRLIAHLWDAETGALIKSLRDTKEHDAYDHAFDKFFWNPAGDVLITAGTSVKLWDRRGELLQDIDANAIVSASLSPNGKFLTFTSDKSLGSSLKDLAKVMVGQVSKIGPFKTFVWQLEG
jgi:WD40 repeat protein